MRRGVFIVGDAHRQSLRRDMAALPGLALSFGVGQSALAGADIYMICI